MTARFPMRELSRRTGVAPATIHFYRNLGLLPAPQRTARTMAYYDERFVRRVRWIKDVQERCRLPLRAIREILDRYDDELSIEEVQAAVAVGELESLPGPAADEAGERPDAICARLGISGRDIDALAEAGILQGPGRDGLLPAGDVRMLELVARLASVFATELGFNAGFLRTYSVTLHRLVRAEIREALTRAAGKLSPEELQSLIHRGVPLLNAFIGELHSQIMQRELRSLALAARDDGTARGDAQTEHPASVTGEGGTP